MACLKTEVGWPYAHRTDVVTGQAVQAPVHVILKVLSKLEFSLDGFGHEGNPSSWGLGFAKTVLVGGTDRKAEPAADAVVYLLFSWAFKAIPG
jgi:hypothetical protein